MRHWQRKNICMFSGHSCFRVWEVQVKFMCVQMWRHFKQKGDIQQTFLCLKTLMPTISVWPPISSKSTCSSPRECESGLESVQDVFRTQEIVQRFTSKMKMTKSELVLLQEHQNTWNYHIKNLKHGMKFWQREQNGVWCHYESS